MEKDEDIFLICVCGSTKHRLLFYRIDEPKGIYILSLMCLACGETYQQSLPYSQNISLDLSKTKPVPKLKKKK